MIGFIGTSLQLQSITTAHSQWVYDSLHSLLNHECLLWRMMNDESLLTNWTLLRMKYLLLHNFPAAWI
jgi:hypothetical protein